MSVAQCPNVVDITTPFAKVYFALIVVVIVDMINSLYWVFMKKGTRVPLTSTNPLLLGSGVISLHDALTKFRVVKFSGFLHGLDSFAG